MKDWLEGQRKQRLMLEHLLSNYNEGKSMSFYCLASMLMPPELIDRATSELKERLVKGYVDGQDLKAKAKALKEIIQGIALEHGIKLKPGKT